MMIGRTAAHYGAAVATSTRVVGFLREVIALPGSPYVISSQATSFAIRCQADINATGVWIDELQEMLGGRGQFLGPRRQKVSTWWCHATASTPMTGLITRTEKSLLFIIPWGSNWIIGTTDTDWRLGSRPSGGQPGRYRLPVGPCQHLLADPLTRDDVSGSTRGSGRCWPASPTRPRSCPGSTPSPRRSAGWS